MSGGEIRFYRASERPYGPFSNCYQRPILFEGRQFSCSECAYQFGKPARQEVADWLIAAPKPHLCAAAAHALLSWDVRSDWQAIKVERMRAILFAKFSQHDDLRVLLLSTGQLPIVEASTTDPFWGIGKRGDGKNMLGQLLMELRDRLA
jgi:ribA/ribD-fused uncharacterized protein